MRTFRAAAWVVAAVLAALLVASPATAAEPLPGPSGWPLQGPARVMAAFDPPDAPWGRGHRGVDLEATVGQPVLAAADGMVTVAGPIAGRGVVVVQHATVRTTYEPVAAQVQAGDSVRTGDVLGTVSTGSHCVSPCLHWGLIRGREYLDPLLLAASRVEMRLLPASALHELRAAGPVTGAAVRSASGSRLLRPAGPMTSAFGMRLHPVRRVWSLHDGTDFAAPCGSPIVAPAAGVVTATAGSEAYGNRLFLDHGVVDGRRLQTASNHAQRYVVHAGERVQRGQVIGFVGSTGYSTGCHQHLMVWADGALADPAVWLGR